MCLPLPSFLRVYVLNLGGILSTYKYLGDDDPCKKKNTSISLYPLVRLASPPTEKDHGKLPNHSCRVVCMSVGKL